MPYSLVVSLCCALAQTASSSIPCPEPLLGFTAPSRKAILGAVLGGRIAALPARAGAHVQKGEVLFELDATVAEARLVSAEALAASDVEERLAGAACEQAQAELRRLESIESNRMSSPKELSDARSLVASTALQLELARFRRAQALREALLQRAIREQHTTRAPFDAVVAERIREEGETLEPRDGVLVLVQLDPLEITVDCPVHIARRVKAGDALLVRNAQQPGDVRAATTTLVGPVVDAASQTTRLRLTVPNADHAWLAGLRVNVEPPALIGTSREREE